MDVVIEHVVGGGGEYSELDRIAAEDSDAMPSVIYPETALVARLLSGTEEQGGGPTTLLRAMQVGVVMNAALQTPGIIGANLEKSGLPEANALLYIYAGMATLAWLSFVPLLGSVSEALRPGGALSRLGAGVVQIGAGDARSLQRWRVGLGAIAVLCTLILIGVGATYLSSVTSLLTGAFVAAIFFVAVPLLLVLSLGWWPSLRLGSVLTRDAITEVIRSADSAAVFTSATAWEEQVTQPALLLDDALRDLATGWARGLESFTLFFWVNALGWFAHALNTELCEAIEARIQAGELDDINGATHECTVQRNSGLALVALFALLPLGLAWDLAATSSRCGEHNDIVMPIPY